MRAFNISMFNAAASGALVLMILLLRFDSCQAAEAGPVRVLVASIDNADMQLLRRLSPHFERDNPDIRLEWVMLSEHALRQQLPVDIASGNGAFDLVTAGAYEVALWARKGWLVAMSDLPAAYDTDDLIDEARRVLTVDGTLQALPFYAEGVLTYFRADLLRRKGLSMPPKPAWSDIVRIAAALHDPAAGISGACLRGRAGWGGNVVLVSAMASAHGARWVGDDRRPRLNSAPWRDSVTRYASLLRQYGPADALSRGFLGNLDLFAAGRCGLWVDASVAVGALQQRLRAPAELGVAPAPVTAEGRHIAWNWVWALAVPRASRQAAAARRFAAWATSREYVALVARTHGWVAAPPGTRKSTYADPGYQAAAPFAALALAAVQDSDASGTGSDGGSQFAAVPEFLSIGTLMGEAIAAVVAGKMSATTAMELAQIKAERVLSQPARGR